MSDKCNTFLLLFITDLTKYKDGIAQNTYIAMNLLQLNILVKYTSASFIVLYGLQAMPALYLVYITYRIKLIKILWHQSLDYSLHNYSPKIQLHNTYQARSSTVDKLPEPITLQTRQISIGKSHYFLRRPYRPYRPYDNETGEWSRHRIWYYQKIASLCCICFIVL